MSTEVAFIEIEKYVHVCSDAVLFKLSVTLETFMSIGCASTKPDALLDIWADDTPPATDT